LQIFDMGGMDVLKHKTGLRFRAKDQAPNVYPRLRDLSEVKSKLLGERRRALRTLARLTGAGPLVWKAASKPLGGTVSGKFGLPNRHP